MNKGIILSAVAAIGLMLPTTADETKGMEAALQLQSAFTGVAEKTSPAVVVITNKRKIAQPQYSEMDPFQFFFGVPRNPRQQRRQQPDPDPQPVGKGSGIIISEDGYILTNYHVIQEADALEVKLHDGTILSMEGDDKEVEIIGSDEDTDLAVIKIKTGQKLPYLEFADSSKVKVGEWSIAVGAPFEQEYSVTVGVVSQKGRYGVHMNYFEDYIQTDASINPGNSGGPLLNLRGEIIGVNDFIITGGGMSRGSVGIGFAIASNLAKRVSDDLIKHQEVVRPWMGVSLQPLSEEFKEQFEVKNGALIGDVFEGDPAEKAGIQPGDVIVKIEGNDVRDSDDFLRQIIEHRPGKKIILTVVRNGKEKEIEVKLGRRQKDADGKVHGVDSDREMVEKAGFSLSENEENEVVITGVRRGSPAASAGLRSGDVILEVNRTNVQTVKDVVKALKKTGKDTSILYVRRGGSRFFVPLELD